MLMFYNKAKLICQISGYPDWDHRSRLMIRGFLIPFQSEQAERACLFKPPHPIHFCAFQYEQPDISNLHRIGLNEHRVRLILPAGHGFQAHMLVKRVLRNFRFRITS